MDKIAVGPAARDVIDFDLPPDELFGRVAESLGLPLTALAVVVLDRPRNQRWVEAARTAGARVRLIADGDLAAAIATAVPDSGINMLVGSGGAREGWLAAAALRGLGGQFLGRYLPFKPQDQRVLAEHGFEAKTPLRWDELLPAEFMLSVTGISDGDALRGIRLHGSHAVSESLLLRTASETVRWIRTERRLSD
jgi:fructose-1,6-bisphosphatase II